MATIRFRNDPVRLFARRLGMLGLFIVICIAIGGVWNGYQKQQESLALRRQAELQLADLTKRQTQLNDDIKNLQTDRGMEQVLREQYALAAKGEKLIVIIDGAKAIPTESTSTIFDKIKRAFKWW